MSLENQLKKFALEFNDKQRAYNYLDSLAYTWINYQILDEKLFEHIGGIIGIAKKYKNEELKILSLFDNVYSVGLKNRYSSISRSINNNILQPLNAISNRIKMYEEEYSKLIKINDLKIVIDQEFLREYKGIKIKRMNKGKRSKKNYRVQKKKVML